MPYFDGKNVQRTAGQRNSTHMGGLKALGSQGECAGIISERKTVICWLIRVIRSEGSLAQIMFLASCAVCIESGLRTCLLIPF
jgi:hypothetical protein